MHSMFQTCFTSIACMHTLPEMVDVWVQAMYTGLQHVLQVIEHVVVQSATLTIYKDTETPVQHWSETTYTSS